MVKAGIGNIGFNELLIIFLILALLFGARKIPDLARGLGEAIREFKKAVKSEDKEKEGKEKNEAKEKEKEEK